MTHNDDDASVAAAEILTALGGDETAPRLTRQALRHASEEVLPVLKRGLKRALCKTREERYKRIANQHIDDATMLVTHYSTRVAAPQDAIDKRRLQGAWYVVRALRSDLRVYVLRNDYLLPCMPEHGTRYIVEDVIADEAQRVAVVVVSRTDAAGEAFFARSNENAPNGGFADVSFIANLVGATNVGATELAGAHVAGFYDVGSSSSNATRGLDCVRVAADLSETMRADIDRALAAALRIDGTHAMAHSATLRRSFPVHFGTAAEAVLQPNGVSSRSSSNADYDDEDDGADMDTEEDDDASAEDSEDVVDDDDDYGSDDDDESSEDEDFTPEKKPKKRSADEMQQQQPAVPSNAANGSNAAAAASVSSDDDVPLVLKRAKADGNPVPCNDPLPPINGNDDDTSSSSSSSGEGSSSETSDGSSSADDDYSSDDAE
jgi:hypothetical protein